MSELGTLTAVKMTSVWVILVTVLVMSSATTWVTAAVTSLKFARLVKPWRS